MQCDVLLPGNGNNRLSFRAKPSHVVLRVHDIFHLGYPSEIARAVVGSVVVDVVNTIFADWVVAERIRYKPMDIVVSLAAVGA